MWARITVGPTMGAHLTYAPSCIATGTSGYLSLSRSSLFSRVTLMPSTLATVRKLSRGKRLIFGTAALLLAWLITELVAWMVLSYVEHAYKFSAHEIQTGLMRTGKSAGTPAEAIHPYLGWVLNPQGNSSSRLFDRTIPVNSLGFSDEEHGIPRRRPDRIVVAITGGSVAWQVSVAGEKLLRQELAQDPRFQGKTLQLVRLAMSGYKQPQQLLALTYMLALGAEFDVLVNIDGYNEVALTIAENAEAGIFAAYPRMWSARMQDVVDPRKQSLSYRLFQARGLRQQIAEDRLHSWLRSSPTLNLIWLIRHKRLEHQIVEFEFELRQQKFRQGAGFAAVGPGQLYQGLAGLHAHVVDLWANSSLQMQRLCQENGIAYLHILQPNQYLPDSKPMTAKEREKFVFPDQEYGHAIQAVYPLMIKRGAILQENGVDLHDLTMLFRQVQEPIYADPFCHYNQRGNDLLAKAIADAIKAGLDRER